VYRLLFTMRGHRFSEGSYPTIAQNVLISIPYFTRLTKMDRVGFEPTTSSPKCSD
jgi:hypothetical protein